LETFGRDARKPNNLWRLIAADRKAPELAKLANRLYEIPVNAASHERCFSHAGILPAQMRSHSQQDKLAMLVQVKPCPHCIGLACHRFPLCIATCAEYH
jgi:hypothetical protein